jgi:succinate dehydrogenase / fumarate reductase iron-sulfur subunit
LEREFIIWRGDAKGGEYSTYSIKLEQGMVVLDALHRIQAEKAPELGVRWNCKAGKCGSCSMEINGRPKLACMTRMNALPKDESIVIQPLKTFPIVKDLVTDVSWNYKQNKNIVPFNPGDKRNNEDRIMYQQDIDRVQEFRKCIECFLCQDVCHILRDQNQKDQFVGPRFMIRLASLEMHPLDKEDRIPQIKNDYGSGMCNITRCCTDVCPEDIQITDNGIIPLKERVVDRYYDPLLRVFNKLFRKDPKLN